jgi:hypothetical protein
LISLVGKTGCVGVGRGFRRLAKECKCIELKDRRCRVKESDRARVVYRTTRPTTQPELPGNSCGSWRK